MHHVRGITTKQPKGSVGARMIHHGMWQIAIRCEGAICSDGIRRNVQITASPDTFYSIPGRVTVKGRTVTGFVTTYEPGELDPPIDDPLPTDYKFIANEYGKKGALLP